MSQQPIKLAIDGDIKLALLVIVGLLASISINTSKTHKLLQQFIPPQPQTEEELIYPEIQDDSLMTIKI